MKIGILADIHEHVENLQSALETFQLYGVDQVVLLGDLFETGERIHDTVDLLSDANAIGIWGNHDLGLCVDVEPETVVKYGESVIGFFRSFQPHVELDSVRFSHGMPTWDASDPEIYYLGEPPWCDNSLTPVFQSFRNPIFLIGHFHRWQISTTKRTLDWDGTPPIVLAPDERYFVVVHGVLNGWCAILDTDSNEFTPCYVGQ